MQILLFSRFVYYPVIVYPCPPHASPPSAHFIALYQRLFVPFTKPGYEIPQYTPPHSTYTTPPPPCFEVHLDKWRNCSNLMYSACVLCCCVLLPACFLGYEVDVRRPTPFYIVGCCCCCWFVVGWAVYIIVSNIYIMRESFYFRLVK